MRTLLGIIGLVLVLAACADDGSSGDGSDVGADPSEAATPSTTPSPSGPRGFDEPLFPGEVDPALDRLVQESVADLAPRLGVDEAEISAVSATSVTWPNGGLGCPEPGMQYAQVLVDGALVELEHGGQVYRYHAGNSGAPFLCDPSRAVAPVGGGDSRGRRGLNRPSPGSGLRAEARAAADVRSRSAARCRRRGR